MAFVDPFAPDELVLDQWTALDRQNLFFLQDGTWALIPDSKSRVVVPLDEQTARGWLLERGIDTARVGEGRFWIEDPKRGWRPT